MMHEIKTDKKIHKVANQKLSSSLKNFQQLIMYFDDDNKIIDVSYQCDDTTKL